MYEPSCTTRMPIVSKCPGQLIILPIRLESTISNILVDRLHPLCEFLGCNILITLGAIWVEGNPPRKKEPYRARIPVRRTDCNTALGQLLLAPFPISDFPRIVTRAGVMWPHIFAGVDCICLNLFLHLIRFLPTHKITPILLLMWVFTPFWIDALPYILGI